LNGTVRVKRRKLNGQRRKNIFVNFIKVIISILLVYFLLRRIGVENIWRQLGNANWWWALLGIASFTLSNILGALQWLLLLRSQNVKLSFWRVVSYYHVGLFFNNFLIGYIGGDAFRIYDVSKQSGDSTTAVSSVVFDRLVGFFMLTTIAMAMSLFWFRRLSSLKTVWFIAAMLVSWILLLFFLFHEKSGKAVGRLFKPLAPVFVTKKIHDIYMAVNHYQHMPGVLAKVFFTSFFVQSLRIMTHYWAARAIGVDVNLIYFAIFIPIIAIFASLPISFGGIGVREQSGVALFSTIGVLASKVATFEFLAYIIGIIAALPGGLFFVLRKEERAKVISLRNKIHRSEERRRPIG